MPLEQPPGNAGNQEDKGDKLPSLYDSVKAGDHKSIKAYIQNHITELLKKYNLGDYEIVLLFDDLDSISDFHSDTVYRAVAGSERKRNILLVVNSLGGKIEPAYLISKTCKKLSKDKFVVAVPRKAKSAATLIALGADEVHLGLLSELGPIDPQINQMPALGLANGLTKVSELVCAHPQSSDMWAKFLSENLSLRQLGYLERLNESAAQYAERLLLGKTLPNGQSAKTLANHFVNHYKDHSFLIDIDEATSLLGPQVVRSGTPEYSFANEIYQEMTMLEFLLKIFQDEEYYYVGPIEADSLYMRKRKPTEA